MNSIKVLDEKTINKIAAGEVVERPFSVVKELCENAIDAKASSISVEIKDGGISFIRVTDNGSGIEKDSIRTAFLRHATSKITEIEDLQTIRSLGFRGEALSSIAAVSQIELMTKCPDSICGIRYRIEGGREMSFDEAGIPDGTTFIVRNLFYNTPARKKFLKSPQSEANTITEFIEKLILSHPEVAIKYIVNGNEKLVSAGIDDLKQVTYSLFGRDISSKLVSIEDDNANVNIYGYVGKPEIGRGNRNYELFFVNGRCVKSKLLSKAVEEAYKPYLMLHKYPFVVLYLDIPSDKIDVNVHPAKTEIRFMDEPGVYNAVFEAVTKGITQKELIPEVTVEKSDNIIKNTIYNDFSSQSDNRTSATVSEVKNETVSEKNYIPEPFEKEKLEKYKTEIKKEFIDTERIVEISQETLFSEGFLDKYERIKHKIIGQVFDTYWIVEYDEKMYIIDQHAAHEKVLYERFSKQIRNNEVISQNLSPTYIISLSMSESDVLSENIEYFRNLGFEIESFGGTEYSVSAVPTELFGMSLQDYFTLILDDLSEIKRDCKPEQISDRIATMACKAAVKGNMKLSYREIEALIDELLTLDNPYNCPHGRPTIISYSKNELEKLFKRIV